MTPENMSQNKPANLDSFTRRLTEDHLDAVLASSAASFFFLSRSMIITHLPIRDRLEMLFWPVSGEPVFVLCDHEKSAVVQESWIKNIRTYVEYQRFPMEVLAEIVKERGLQEARIGIEINYLRTQYFEELREYLPDAAFIPCDHIFKQSMMIKSPDDIKNLQHAARLTEQAIREGLTNGQTAKNEKVLARRITQRVSELGANGFSEVVAAGVHSLHNYPAPVSEELKKGDLVRVDLKGIFSGYASDVGRMAVVGQPSQTQREAYYICRDAQREVIHTIKPGMTAASVYDLYKKKLYKKDLSLSQPYVGHSIGFGGQEYPVLHPLEQQVLEPDMVLALEPVFDLDGIRFKLEDTIRITDNGADWLTDPAGIEDMIVIPI